MVRKRGGVTVTCGEGEKGKGWLIDLGHLGIREGDE